MKLHQMYTRLDQLDYDDAIQVMIRLQQKRIIPVVIKEPKPSKEKAIKTKPKQQDKKLTISMDQYKMLKNMGVIK